MCMRLWKVLCRESSPPSRGLDSQYDPWPWPWKGINPTPPAWTSVHSPPWKPCVSPPSPTREERALAGWQPTRPVGQPPADSRRKRRSWCLFSGIKTHNATLRKGVLPSNLAEGHRRCFPQRRWKDTPACFCGLTSAVPTCQAPSEIGAQTLRGRRLPGTCCPLGFRGSQGLSPSTADTCRGCHGGQLLSLYTQAALDQCQLFNLA